MTYSREDDLVIALQQATELMSHGRFSQVACVENEASAAHRVTQIADMFVAWLRRPTHVTLTFIAVEETDTGEIATTTREGNMTDIDSSQRARYSVTAKDDRNFDADYALGARASNPGVATVEYFNIGDAGNTSNGTALEVDQVLATFAGTFGTTTVEVYDPANPEVVLAADTLVANPGAVASAQLGTAVIEEIPVEEPPAPPVEEPTV